MGKIKKVGIVTMPRISVGGGFARVARDLVSTLNSLGKKVYLLNPFEVNLDKIKELHGTMKVEKIYGTDRFKAFFSREDSLGRKLLISEFQKMAGEVDFIIDLDGGVFHKYLPENFNKKNYVVWRISCINPETHKIQKSTNAKIIIKSFVRSFVQKKEDIPGNFKIYAVDDWTRREVEKFWKVPAEKNCLYPEIKVNDFNSKGKKKSQIAIFGRIAKNKNVEESIRIFYEGTRKHPEYNLIILGGMTPDSGAYIKTLGALIEKLKIKDKVEIIGDPSFEKIKDVLADSRVLIDSQIGVSLTMTAIEAMASGCSVIARKNGGTFKEVLDNGKYGSGFNKESEGAKILDSQLSKKKTDVRKSVIRARFFSPDNFRMRVEAIVNGR